MSKIYINFEVNLPNSKFLEDNYIFTPVVDGLYFKKGDKEFVIDIIGEKDFGIENGVYDARFKGCLELGILNKSYDGEEYTFYDEADTVIDENIFDNATFTNLSIDFDEEDEIFKNFMKNPVYKNVRINIEFQDKEYDFSADILKDVNFFGNNVYTDSDKNVEEKADDYAI